MLTTMNKLLDLKDSTNTLTHEHYYHLMICSLLLANKHMHALSISHMHVTAVVFKIH